jgi:DNA-directed RNA polymerase subunit RPC12/RpoP
MSATISCPDCNSNNIEERVKNATIITEDTRSLTQKLVGWPFYKKKEQVEIKTLHDGYICRECGRDFRD